MPALDEEASAPKVISGIAAHVDAVVLVDNGSRDATSERARAAGAQVVLEPRRGYGAACHAGIAKARALDAEAIVFLDADGSEDPAEAPSLLEPLAAGRADLVLGVRRSASIEPGAMTPVQRFGNWFAPLSMRLLTGARYSDLPPFKAITVAALDRLSLSDRGHGFTIELLLEAHRAGLRVREVPVRCRVRQGGHSKVSGTVKGSARAAFKILSTIALHSLRGRRR